MNSALAMMKMQINHDKIKIVYFDHDRKGIAFDLTFTKADLQEGLQFEKGTCETTSIVQ